MYEIINLFTWDLNQMCDVRMNERPKIWNSFSLLWFRFANADDDNDIDDDDDNDNANDSQTLVWYSVRTKKFDVNSRWKIMVQISFTCQRETVFWCDHIKRLNNTDACSFD